MMTRLLDRLAARPELLPSDCGRAVALLLLSLGVSLGFASTSSPARADESLALGDESLRSWTLYANPEAAVYAHTGKGSSEGTPITGPRIPNPNPNFGDLGPDVYESLRSRERIVSFPLGITFGALTPALDVWGRPRLFVDFNAAWPVASEVELARKSRPGTVAFPRGPRPAQPVGEGVMNGQGSSLSAQPQGPHLHAGIGASLEFPIPGDQLIRLKPSVMYSRTRLDITGVTVRPIRLTNDQTEQQNLDDFRILNFREKRQKYYHAVGPSFELEYLPGLEWGPFTMSLYARGHAAHILNSLQTRMQQCNDAGGFPDECMSWKYTQDRWTYRATVGVHLNWMPRVFW